MVYRSATPSHQTTIDTAEDSSISQAMLDSAQERVAAMENEVAGLRDKFQRTSEESKEKLQ